MIAELSRLARRSDPERVPRAVEDEPGIFAVDATWGVIQAISLAPGVRTVGELELSSTCAPPGRSSIAGYPCTSSAARFLGRSTSPTARSRSGLRSSTPWSRWVVFCNGPQCTATAKAIDALLAAGLPAERLQYYRGGIHDWVTLGLPLATPAS